MVNFCKVLDVKSLSPISTLPTPSSLTLSASTITPRTTNQLIYLRHLVTCMMDLLTVTEQIVLKFSSVIGLKFSLPILTQILPSDAKKRVSKAIKTLISRRFITHYPSEESIYTFQNYNIRDVIYSLIPPR